MFRLLIRVCVLGLLAVLSGTVFAAGGLPSPDATVLGVTRIESLPEIINVPTTTEFTYKVTYNAATGSRPTAGIHIALNNAYSGNANAKYMFGKIGIDTTKTGACTSTIQLSPGQSCTLYLNAPLTEADAAYGAFREDYFVVCPFSYQSGSQGACSVESSPKAPTLESVGATGLETAQSKISLSGTSLAQAPQVGLSASFTVKNITDHALNITPSNAPKSPWHLTYSPTVSTSVAAGQSTTFTATATSVPSVLQRNNTTNSIIVNGVNSANSVDATNPVFLNIVYVNTSRQPAPDPLTLSGTLYLTAKATNKNVGAASAKTVTVTNDSSGEVTITEVEKQPLDNLLDPNLTLTNTCVENTLIAGASCTISVSAGANSNNGSDKIQITYTSGGTVGTIVDMATLNAVSAATYSVEMVHCTGDKIGTAVNAYNMTKSGNWNLPLDNNICIKNTGTTSLDSTSSNLRVYITENNPSNYSQNKYANGKVWAGTAKCCVKTDLTQCDENTDNGYTTKCGTIAPNSFAEIRLAGALAGGEGGSYPALPNPEDGNSKTYVFGQVRYDIVKGADNTVLYTDALGLGFYPNKIGILQMTPFNEVSDGLSYKLINTFAATKTLSNYTLALSTYLVEDSSVSSRCTDTIELASAVSNDDYTPANACNIGVKMNPAQKAPAITNPTVTLTPDTDTSVELTYMQGRAALTSAISRPKAGATTIRSNCGIISTASGFSKGLNANACSLGDFRGMTIDFPANQTLVWYGDNTTMQTYTTSDKNIFSLPSPLLLIGLATDRSATVTKIPSNGAGNAYFTLDGSDVSVKNIDQMNLLCPVGTDITSTPCHGIMVARLDSDMLPQLYTFSYKKVSPSVISNKHFDNYDFTLTKVEMPNTGTDAIKYGIVLNPTGFTLNNTKGLMAVAQSTGQQTDLYRFTLDVNGALTLQLITTLQGKVNSIACSPDGVCFAAGAFTNANASITNFLKVSLDNTVSAASGFTAGTVYDMKFIGSKLYVGGQNIRVNGATTNYPLAEFDPSSGSWVGKTDDAFSAIVKISSPLMPESVSDAIIFVGIGASSGQEEQGKLTLTGKTIGDYTYGLLANEDTYYDQVFDEKDFSLIATHAGAIQSLSKKPSVAKLKESVVELFKKLF